MQYGEWGNEPDYALIPMCSVCHKDFHKRYGSRGNLIKETLYYCERKQNMLKGLMEVDTKNGKLV